MPDAASRSIEISKSLPVVVPFHPSSRHVFFFTKFIAIRILSETQFLFDPFLTGTQPLLITMSAPGGAPSPVPRSGSMGPGANGSGMSMNSQQPLSGPPVHPPPTPGPPPPQSGAMSQQNLNQIVSNISYITISSLPLLGGGSTSHTLTRDD